MKLLILSLVLMSGCASMQTASKASSKNSINGEGKYLDIARDLTRASISGIVHQNVRYYAISYPITPAVAKSRDLETCKKNMESDCLSKADASAKEAQKKSCYYLEVSTMAIEMAKADFWKIKVEQGGKIYEGNISGFRAVPSLDSDPVRPWSNLGMVCLNEKVNFEMQQTMHLIPQTAGENDALKLVWENAK